MNHWTVPQVVDHVRRLLMSADQQTVTAGLVTLRIELTNAFAARYAAGIDQQKRHPEGFLPPKLDRDPDPKEITSITVQGAPWDVAVTWVDGAPYCYAQKIGTAWFSCESHPEAWTTAMDEILQREFAADVADKDDDGDTEPRELTQPRGNAYAEKFGIPA
jgi:hypothetical protein